MCSYGVKQGLEREALVEASKEVARVLGYGRPEWVFIPEWCELPEVQNNPTLNSDSVNAVG